MKFENFNRFPVDSQLFSRTSDFLYPLGSFGFSIFSELSKTEKNWFRIEFWDDFRWVATGKRVIFYRQCASKRTHAPENVLGDVACV